MLSGIFANRREAVPVADMSDSLQFVFEGLLRVVEKEVDEGSYGGEV